jgi:hypothetical protein
MTPLFIPLKTEYYEQFKAGAKTHELREFGPRWNFKTCCVGRRVTLSKGYGSADRIEGVINSFDIKHGSRFRDADAVAIEAIYGSLDVEIAVIGIEVKR